MPLLNSRKVRLLSHKRLTSQLLGLERNTARGGKDSIDHARGGHDDLANAAAGALVNATVKAFQVRINGFAVGSDGKLIGHPNPKFRSTDDGGGYGSRIVVRHLTEKEDLAERGLL